MSDLKSTQIRLTREELYELSGICSVVWNEKFDQSLIFKIKMTLLYRVLIYVTIQELKSKFLEKAKKWAITDRKKGWIWFNPMQQAALTSMYEIVQNPLLEKILAKANLDNSEVQQNNVSEVN